MVYIHNGILFSHKKKEILPFVKTWMNLEGSVLIEINQRQILYDLTYMWNQKKVNSWKQNGLVVARGGMGRCR